MNYSTPTFKNRIVFFYLFLAAFCLQKEILPQQNKLVFETLTADNGLSQGTITCILQDSRGFMWFGTKDGLNRYDGYTFTVFRNFPEDSNSISSNQILALFEDSSENIWVGTDGGGANCYNPLTGNFSRFLNSGDEQKSLSDDIVTAIAEDGNGMIWFGTKRGGLNRFDPKQNEFKHFRTDPSDQLSLSSDFVTAVLSPEIESPYLLYVGTNLGGLNLLNRETGKFQHALWDPNDANRTNGEIVTSISEDKKGTLWLGTFCGGLFEFSPTTSKTTRHKVFSENPSSEIGNCIRTVLNENEQYVWLGSDDSYLFKFDKTKSEFIEGIIGNSADENFKSYGALSLFKDKGGVLWIGTNGNGLKFTKPGIRNFTNITKNDNSALSLNFSSVRSIFEDRLGILWIGGYNGLDRIDRQAGIVSHYFPEEAVYSICSDGDTDILWIGTEGHGLFKFEKSTGSAKQYPSSYNGNGSSLKGSFVFKIICDYDGKLWIGTNRGLNRFDPAEEKFEQIDLKSDDSDKPLENNVKSIYQDSNGIIWIGTNLSGLLRFDPEESSFEYFNTESSGGLSNNIVYSIYEDKKGRFWIGTGNGLNMLIPEQRLSKKLFVEDGLPNNVVYAILEDNTGSLWLSTNEGISRMNPGSGIPSFRNFNTVDGLPGSEFNSGAYFQSSSGEMFFGGVAGVTSFFPENIVMNNYQPPVVLTSFKKFNKEIHLNPAIETRNELTLSYSDVVVSFEFSALNYFKSSKNQYSYILEGLHQNWIDLGTKHEITFTNLDHGSYTLIIRGSNNDGMWSENPLTLAITVVPPLWETTWAYLIYAVIIITSIIGFIHWRTYRTQRENIRLEKLVKERTEELRVLNANKDRFFSIVSHDIKSPLYSLRNFSGIVKNKFKKLNDEQKQDAIDEIYSTVDESCKYLNNLLDWSRLQMNRFEFQPRKFSIQDIIDESVKFFSASAKNKGILIKSSIENQFSVFADYEMVSIVLRNLISNAVKFTNRNGQIEISSCRSEGFVETTVEDNGIGIEKATAEKIFRLENSIKSLGTENEKGTGLGLILSRDLIIKNGGNLSFTTEPGKGSKFIFTLPGS